MRLQGSSIPQAKVEFPAPEGDYKQIGTKLTYKPTCENPCVWLDGGGFTVKGLS